MKRIWQRLSNRERGLVILSLLIFLLVLVRYLLISPFLERREWVKNQLEIQPQLLEKNLRHLARRAGIEAGVEKARAELRALEPSLLSGDTLSVIASDLQQTAQALAAKEGVQVISTRVLNPEAMGAFTKIPIQMEVGGQIDQVVNLLKGIESAEKLLVLSELNIRSLFLPVAGRPQTARPALVQNLRASLVVSGFARTQAATPAKGEAAAGRVEAERRKAPAKGLGAAP